MPDKKKAEQALGTSRGGVTTKVHALTDGLGRCIAFTLTEGKVHDSTQMQALLQKTTPENVLADKAYDSDAIRQYIGTLGATPVIPPRSCRVKTIEYDKHTYKDRCLVENFFQFLKRYRRLGTRYEMTARNYAGMVTIGCLIQWLIF